MPSRKEFDHIIEVYSNGRPGSAYITRGDYELVHVQDGQFVNHSEFTSVVESGMTFDMSITKREGMVFRDIKEKCPRCHHVNPHANTSNGWIEW